MSVRHFVLWVDGTSCHLASRNSYRKGEEEFRKDDIRAVPAGLVEDLGSWDYQTPINGPFPRFAATRAVQIENWLRGAGYRVQRLPDRNVAEQPPVVGLTAVEVLHAGPPSLPKLARPQDLNALRPQWGRILEVADGLRPGFGYLTDSLTIPTAQSGTQISVQFVNRSAETANVTEWNSTLEGAMSTLFGFSWIVTIAS